MLSLTELQMRCRVTAACCRFLAAVLRAGEARWSRLALKMMSLEDCAGLAL